MIFTNSHEVQDSTRGIRHRMLWGAAHGASALAVLGTVLLLLADDAGPQCTASAVDLNYQVETTCFEVASGRIHISVQKGESWRSPSVTIESGQLNLESVAVSPANCEKDDNPEVPGSVHVTVAKVAKVSATDAGLGARDSGAAGAAGELTSGALVPSARVLERRYCSVRIPVELGDSIECSVSASTTSSAGCALRLTEVKLPD